MSIEKNFFNLLYLGSKYKQPTRMPMPNPRHLVGILPKYHDNSSRRKTRNLIKTLLVHGARSARINQPRSRIAINVFSPHGTRAVRLKMAK